MNTQEIVSKLWNLCNVLRDDGITYHQYVTELTYILFLKMMQEKYIMRKKVIVLILMGDVVIRTWYRNIRVCFVEYVWKRWRNFIHIQCLKDLSSSRKKAICHQNVNRKIFRLLQREIKMLER